MRGCWELSGASTTPKIVTPSAWPMRHQLLWTMLTQMLCLLNHCHQRSAMQQCLRMYYKPHRRQALILSTLAAWQASSRLTAWMKRKHSVPSCSLLALPCATHTCLSQSIFTQVLQPVSAHLHAVPVLPTHSGSAPTASVPAAISQPSANSGSTMPAAFRAAASPPTPYARGPAMPSRQPAPLARSPAMPSRHATPASTGAVHGQQASRRPGPAHCDADELWASWHWGNGALHGASAPNMAQCAPQPPHAPKKR